MNLRLAASFPLSFNDLAVIPNEVRDLIVQKKPIFKKVVISSDCQGSFHPMHKSNKSVFSAMNQKAYQIIDNHKIIVDIIPLCKLDQSNYNTYIVYTV